MDKVIKNIFYVSIVLISIILYNMVGALSIVRFRTAIKDSMDIVFMFWAIAIGIVNGAGYFKISIIGSIFIAIILFILTKYKEKTSPYLLIINYDGKNYDEIKKYFSKLGWYKVKSKTITKDNSEITLEMRSDNEHKVIDEISQLDGVKNFVMVAYNGGYVS
jgi:uncharacterized membrane protein YhiD involved in acid resistance